MKILTFFFVCLSSETIKALYNMKKAIPFITGIISPNLSVFLSIDY